MRLLLYGLIAFAWITVVYFGLLRPWHLRWGATWEERAKLLPGDDFVVRPRTGSTRAVTIDAPPEQVWPWLAQMGQGRGGLYSYDWLENLFGCDVHSSDEVLPELQQVAVGDTIRLVREGHPADLFFEVAFVHPGRALVLKSPGDPDGVLAAGMAYTTWAFVLDRLPDRKTRLLSRWRTDFRPTLRGYFWWKFGPSELVSFVMERKMLKGIRQRAEGSRGRGRSRRSRQRREA
jgi:hypothetical protein